MPPVRRAAMHAEGQMTNDDGIRGFRFSVAPADTGAARFLAPRTATHEPAPAVPGSREIGVVTPEGKTATRLTSRETDVLEMLATGNTYEQVGDRLGVSLNTVASHVKSIYRKLEVHSARAAVWRALELRLLGEPE